MHEKLDAIRNKTGMTWKTDPTDMAYPKEFIHSLSATASRVSQPTRIRIMRRMEEEGRR